MDNYFSKMMFNQQFVNQAYYKSAFLKPQDVYIKPFEMKLIKGILEAEFDIRV